MKLISAKKTAVQAEQAAGEINFDIDIDDISMKSRYLFIKEKERLFLLGADYAEKETEIFVEELVEFIFDFEKINKTSLYTFRRKHGGMSYTSIIEGVRIYKQAMEDNNNHKSK